MLSNSRRFIYGFFILFLSILLLMFVMFAVMVHYDRDVQMGGDSSAVSSQGREPTEATRDTFRDLTPLYGANLFVINLCLIVLAETLLILLFVRFTIPATLVATVGIIIMTLNISERLRRELIPGLLSRLVTNRYATLSHTDMLLLIILNGLIMAFLMSVLLKYSIVEAKSQESQTSPPPSPSPPSAI